MPEVGGHQGSAPMAEEMADPSVNSLWALQILRAQDNHTHTCCSMLSMNRYFDVLQVLRGGFCRCHIHSWASRVNGGILCAGNPRWVVLLQAVSAASTPP